MVGGPGSVSVSRIRSWNQLTSLGLNAEQPSEGRPQVRGQAGFVKRWGELWFEEIRDTPSFGWEFEKHDKMQVSKLVELLLKRFRQKRQSQPLAICDTHRAIADAGEGELVRT